MRLMWLFIYLENVNLNRAFESKEIEKRDNELGATERVKETRSAAFSKLALPQFILRPLFCN
jgi:hypothetical protein